MERADIEKIKDGVIYAAKEKAIRAIQVQRLSEKMK